MSVKRCPPARSALDLADVGEDVERGGNHASFHLPLPLVLEVNRANDDARAIRDISFLPCELMFCCNHQVK